MRRLVQTAVTAVLLMMMGGVSFVVSATVRDQRFDDAYFECWHAKNPGHCRLVVENTMQTEKHARDVGNEIGGVFFVLGLCTLIPGILMFLFAGLAFVYGFFLLVVRDVARVIKNA